MESFDRHGKANEGHILLITDGEENVHPYIADVKPELISKNVHVTSILYTKDAEESVIELSSDTGGKYYYDEGTGCSTNLMQSLKSFVDQISCSRKKIMRVPVSKTCRFLYIFAKKILEIV